MRIIYLPKRHKTTYPRLDKSFEGKKQADGLKNNLGRSLVVRLSGRVSEEGT